MVPVLTGTNTGVVRLKVAGLYLVEADASLGVTAATVARLAIKINGAVRKLTSFTLPSTGGDNPFAVASIRIKRSDLADTTYADEAKLEVTLTNTSSASATISSGSSELTALTITFLG
jgi:predicted membrane-bound mannosyltransferase